MLLAVGAGVIESDEAGEELLLQRLRSGAALGQEVGWRGVPELRQPCHDSSIHGAKPHR